MVAALVLAALVLAAGLSGWTRGGGVAALAVLSILWLLVNEPMEGATLVRVTPTHGLTSADLAGLAGLGIAAVRGLALRRESRRPAGRAEPRPETIA